MSRHYHFIGIGGVGMGAIAALLIRKGERVSGSDLKDGKIARELRKLGARVEIGHRAENLGDCDVVVYSSAVTEENPELARARERKLTVLKRAQMLSQLANPETEITVAGAHGKTTTTSMASFLLIQAGLDPTTAVGGIVHGGYQANLGAGRYFVAEVDESDGSFLFFTPNYSLITNIDFEHLDYYHNWDNIIEAYRQFIARTKPGGTIIACGDDPRLRPLLKGVDAQVLTYGLGADNDLTASGIHLEGYRTVFDCTLQGERLGRFELKVPGQHNVLNAMAVILLGLSLKIGRDVIARALSRFGGVERRFQLKGEVNGILVIDDYGHHPTEIAATLKAARGFASKRIVVAFQPHRYSRTQALLDEFTACLKEADHLVLTEIYAASEKPIPGVSGQVLFDRIKRQGTDAVYLKKEDIAAHLVREARSGDLILTLGAGDITRISEDVVKGLKERFSPAGSATGGQS